MKDLLKKKRVRIGLLAIILLVVMGTIGANAQSIQRREEYKGHIEAAEKYLSVLDYEQAIAEYILALEIEPKSEEALSGLEQAYLAYARSYADMGDYEGAIDILEEGYSVTERASLREQTEEYRELQQMTEQEAENENEVENAVENENEAEEETEDARDDDMKQMVESDKFQQQLLVLVGIVNTNPQNISDREVRELCWPMIEALEQYRELYPENGGYYEFLPYLYYLVGEYGLCTQIMEEFRELFPDNNNLSAYYKDENGGTEITRDEYGRITGSTTVYPNSGKQVEEYEYGQDGKVMRTFLMNDTGRIGEVQVITTSTSEYEYDSEGRLSQITTSQEDNPGGTIISVFTYAYSGGGFTAYENVEGYRGAYKITRDYVINEYGWAEMVGEPIYEEIQ